MSCDSTDPLDPVGSKEDPSPQRQGIQTLHPRAIQ